MNVVRSVALAIRQGKWIAGLAVAWFAWVGPLAAQPAPGEVWRDCGDCPEMVAVPAGLFIMGSNAQEQVRFGVKPEQAPTELPAHSVRIARAFAVARFAVTRDEWAAYVAAQAVSTPRPDDATAAAAGCAVLSPSTGRWGVDAERSWRDPGFTQTGREPAVCINWYEAQGYAQWMSQRTGRHYRLLTEAEWEFAARAGTTTANYWGDDRENACTHTNASDLTRAQQQADARAPDSSFACRDGHVFTAPVDAFAPNAFGLYGMSGNVWQWVQDCYSANHEGAPADGAARMDGDCAYRIDRGASWVNSPRYVRAAARHKDLVAARTSVLGVRLARDLD